jgi:hypothetical protein
MVHRNSNEGSKKASISGPIAYSKLWAVILASRSKRQEVLTAMSRAHFTRTALLTLLVSLQFQPLHAEDCSGKPDPSDLRRCEDMFARTVEAGSQISELRGGWRLVKTRNPHGGPDAVSVLHAADTARSDLNFAGLTFRCSQTGIETLVILLQPLVRGSQYKVLVKSGSAETQFEGTATQGGEVLSLPPSATTLADGSWQAVPDLTVDIAGPSPIRGAVPIGGLSDALSALSKSCSAH